MTRTETRRLDPPVRYEFSRNVGPGRVVRVQQGTPGRVVQTFEVHMRNGKAVRRVMTRETRVDPKPTLYHMGRHGLPSSRGGFDRARVMTVTATAYLPRPREMGRRATGRTATGERARFGLIAVDPRVIPLGTLVFVEGYGFARAADTGGAIKGKKIDVCLECPVAVRNWGRRQVRIHILRS